MVMAGLWDEWHDKRTGERVKSCTIITCPPNGIVGVLHDRMPVILAERIWPVNRRRIGDVRNKNRDVALPEVPSRAAER
jgi:hypothetical protein